MNITLNDFDKPTHRCCSCRSEYYNNLKALDCCYYKKVEKIRR